jgi:hypothetical protein
MKNTQNSRPKKMTILFFVYFGTHNNKTIQFINKPVFLFSFFPCFCFAFISKQQQQQKSSLYTISVCYGWALQKLYAILLTRRRLFPRLISLIDFTIHIFCVICAYYYERIILISIS